MTALYVPPTGETDQKKQNQSIQLIGGILTTAVTNIATNTASIAQHESAWVAYTPTVTALTGTFTSVAGSGRYKQIGKTVFFVVNVTITTNGTAATAIALTLPVTAISANGAFSGRENALTGVGLTSILNSTTQMIIQKYDGTYLGSNGSVFVVSGTYDAA